MFSDAARTIGAADKIVAANIDHLLQAALPEIRR